MNLTLPDALYATLKARKVLVQLSGGKDSCSLVLLMKRAVVEIEAIHFFHEYAYSIPSEMAENICSRTGVNLVKMDITVELQDTLVRHSTDRPCRHCKAIMDRLTIEYASTIDIVPDIFPFAGWLDDIMVATAVVRLARFDLERYRRWREKAD